MSPSPPQPPPPAPEMADESMDDVKEEQQHHYHVDPAVQSEDQHQAIHHDDDAQPIEDQEAHEQQPPPPAPLEHGGGEDHQHHHHQQQHDADDVQHYGEQQEQQPHHHSHFATDEQHDAATAAAAAAVAAVAAQDASQHVDDDHHHAHFASTAFATPARPTPSSHAEAQAALAAVAAAASAGGFQLTPAPDQASTSYATTNTNSAVTAPVTPAPSPFGTHLGRNKACQSCRARKLKCDGQKPVCGQCAKAWAIKFRVAQNKSKNKKNKNAQDELSKLPDHIPPCEYLPITQRSASSSAAKAGGGGRPSTPSLGDASGTADDTGSPSSATLAARKRKRGDDGNDQVQRMQQEIEDLKRQLSQVTELAKLPGGASRLPLASLAATSNVGRGGDRHPSKDELAIAHLLATSMPTGENHSEGQISSQGQPPQGYAATVTSAPGDHPQQQQFAVQNGDTNLGIDVLDPALDPAFFTQDAPGAFLPTTTNSGPMHSSHAVGFGGVASTSNARQGDEFASPLLELMMSTWPSDFPPPTMVTLLVTMFFGPGTSQGAPLHTGRFMHRLSLGPQHPMFPNRGVLHCIFALIYPRIAERASHMPGSNIASSVAANLSGSTFAEKLDSAKAAAAFHAERAKFQYRKACNDANFHDAAVIMSLLCSYHYHTDESFDAWITASTAASLVKAMELNRLPPARSLAPDAEHRPETKKGAKPQVYRALCMRPTRDPVEHEERVRLFWNVYYTDRMACASTYWATSIDEAEILTELPAPSDDWTYQSSQLIYRERQTLQSPDLFTAKHWDPLVLHTKSMILHAKIITYMSRLPLDATVEDTMTAEFFRLDGLCSDFLSSFPEQWRSLQHFDPALLPTGDAEPDFLTDGINNTAGRKEIHWQTPHLLMAHTLSYGAVIALHEPVAAFSSDSAMKSDMASDNVLNILKILKSARIDMSYVGSSMSLILVECVRCCARRYKDARNRVTEAYLQIRRYRQETGGGGAPLPQNEKDLEDEMEAEMEYDPLLQSQVDPDGAFASLRDDLELVFWYLVKYGEVVQLGVGQARIVAKLLGKDYSPSMDKAGLFSRVGQFAHDASSQSGQSATSSGYSIYHASGLAGPIDKEQQQQQQQQQQQGQVNGAATSSRANDVGADFSIASFHS